jgi:DNA replication protein DnaC
MTATCDECRRELEPDTHSTVCDECLERFQTERDARSAKAERELERQTAERTFARKLEVLPATLRHRDLADLDHSGCEQVIEAAGAWARGDFQGLAVIGPFGVGKTTILAAASRERMKERLAVRWISVPLALSHLSRDFNHPKRLAVLDTISEGGGALLLDDVDKARPTPHAAETLFTAIDVAITEGVPLGLTTNLKLSELAQRWPAPYGDAIASRIAGYCRVIHLDGADRRLAA